MNIIDSSEWDAVCGYYWDAGDCGVPMGQETVQTGM